MSPCRYSVTCFDRCLPARSNPSCVEQRAELRAPRRSSTANSRNAMPEIDGAAGGSNSSMRSTTRGLRLRLLAALLRARFQPVAHLPFEIEQRAHRVDGGAAVRRLAEQIVEDFERHRAGVARQQHLLEESSRGRTGPARESCGSAAPTAARPSRAAARRPAAGRRSSRPECSRCRTGSSLQRQRVEAVEDQAEMRMVGALDDRPRLPEQVDVAPPGQRLEADAQVAPRGALGELVELRGGALLLGQRRWETCSSTRASAARRAPA